MLERTGKPLERRNKRGGKRPGAGRPRKLALPAPNGSHNQIDSKPADLVEEPLLGHARPKTFVRKKLETPDTGQKC
jgi:hypothetical protein